MFAYQLSGELIRRGHEVATIYLYPSEGEGVLPPRPGDVRLDGDAQHRLETLLGFRPALLRRLSKVIRSFRPHVTQLNGARTLKYGVLSRRLSGAPVGRLIYRNIGAPQDWVLGLRRRTFYRLISGNIDGVASITRGSLELLRSRFPEPTLLGVISNAVDPQGLEPEFGRAAVRASASTPNAAPVVLFVGALSPEKRPDRLLDAVRKVRQEAAIDLHAWIVGDGRLREALEAEVRKSGPLLSRAVRFFGTRDDVGSFYGAADFLALVSDTEGIPAVLLEAGFSGLPVVATAVGGVPECVVDGVTGLLIRPDDAAGLADALARLAADPALRRRLGEEAHRRVLEHHSIERIGREFLDFYRLLG